MKSGLVAEEISKTHDTGWGHPECRERFDAVVNALASAGLRDRMEKLSCEPASRTVLERCHSPAYLDLAQREIAGGHAQLSTGDTAVSGASWDAALMAAGAGISAVDAVVEGRVTNAFCVVRPPGHHATPNSGMGFCILNNIAIAARHAQQHHGLERVAIVDWDVHHGNGTQDIFYEDGSVLFFSTHQWPLYPGTGAAPERGRGDGEGMTINCPFPAGAGMAEIGRAFRNRLEPALDDFWPDMIFISAGFDSRIDDPLGGFVLTDADFGDLTLLLRKAAERHCGGRLVSMLEGGYNLEGLGRAAAAHAEALTQ